VVLATGSVAITFGRLLLSQRKNRLTWRGSSPIHDRQHDAKAIAHEIEQAGAHLKVIEQAVDTSTATGRAFFGMLAVFAAFETDVRRERQLEGIAMAKRQGAYKGGKARLDRERVKKLADDGVGPAVIARELGMARSSVYRLLGEGRDHGRSRGNKRPAATP
jgi:DNA invertase Pin-like site-specific DNA recombinase